MSPWHLSRHILSFVLWFSWPCLIRTQTTSTSHGHSHVGTLVQDNPVGIPSLTYDCAKLPAVCDDINARYSLRPVHGGVRDTADNSTGYHILDPDMNPTHSRSAVDKEAPTTNSVTATIAPRTGPPHGLELRILPVGASITVGYRSNENGGDGNGYRLQLFKDLSHDYHVIFAGTRSQGTMKDGYFAAWTGRTIEEIEKLVPPSLQQRPNIILIHAGTNDMSSNPKIAQQGNTPNGAVERLGNLIDECVAACPDATVLVAQIIHTCRKDGSEQRIEEFNSLIPGVVGKRVAAGHHVMAVNLQSFPLDQLHQDDCIHPTNKGYKTLGSMWARAIRTIPEDWVKAPVGHDPVRASGKAPSLNIPCLPWMVVWMAVSYFILKLEAIGS